MPELVARPASTTSTWVTAHFKLVTRGYAPPNDASGSVEMATSGLRLRLLEPSLGVVGGGCVLLVHGRGFRPPPHSLLVRFRLSDARDCKVDVPGRFLLESQLEVVVPSFESEFNAVVSSRTNLAMSSASVTSAPQVLRVSVEVILDSTVTSNTLEYRIHQALAVRRICPQHVLMAPPTTVTLTLNILKLPSRLATSTKVAERPLDEISSLPVFVRVKQKAERTGIVSEQTRPGRWSVSPQGVFEVEFDAVMLAYGPALVEVSLNRVHYFHGADKSPETMGYRVQRDVLIETMDPSTIDVASGRATEVRIFGTGFIDSGDLVVSLAQRELPTKSAQGANQPLSIVTIAQLNATFVSSKEIHCNVQANMPFGLTTFRVSPNGGKQFGNTSVVALLYRNRPLEAIAPANGSLSGNTTVKIHHLCLPLEAVDALSQVQNLVPPKKVRIRFQALNADGSPIEGLCKTVSAEGFTIPGEGGGDSRSTELGAILCRTPSFMEELKTLQGLGQKVLFDYDGDVPLRVKRCKVSIALGSDAFFGALDFAYYFPPTIRSITRHHGPSSGGTSIILRMKYKVPCRLPILVRFLSLKSNLCKIVNGRRFTDSTDEDQVSERQQFKLNSTVNELVDDDPDCLICVVSPNWNETEELPLLTKIQISYDGGTEFYPLDAVEPPPLTSPRSQKMSFNQTVAQAMVRDWSYLYFLFYKTPTFNAVLPMSADIQGGSSIRIMGDDIIDHGAQVSVIFHSPHMSRKVLGFVEKGEVRCCAPPFNVGPVSVYVSFNSEQYTKCAFRDPETTRLIDFVFYSSPSIQSISPLCASVSKPSVIKIFGANLIETGRIKVRFSFINSHGKSTHKDVPGKARDGVITATTPMFPNEFANSTASVDVALNSNDFTGSCAMLHYFGSYQIQRVEPRIGAAEIPIPLTIHLSPSLVTDKVMVLFRFKVKALNEETSFGPIDVKRWRGDRFELTLPAVAEYTDTIAALENLSIDVSFDGASFHTIGDLLSYYKIYNIPHLTSMTPLYGLFDCETEIVAHGSYLQLGDTVKIALYLQSESRSGESHTQIPAAIVVGEVNVKRQTMVWRCPPLTHICSDTRSGTAIPGRMILEEYLTMRISVIDGQAMALPFRFRYYRMPLLLAMDPSIGYTCSGSVVSFEFEEVIETPTVDFRFGKSEPSGGRVRENRFVECFSPEVEKGAHEVSVSFNEQHYKLLHVNAVSSASVANTETKPVNSKDDMADKLDEYVTEMPKVATFEAFPLPVFMVPRSSDRVCGFGPISGGTIVLIKGLGFVPGTRIYVRFCSPYKDGLGEGTSDVIVKAGVVDAQTIQCATPPSLRPGRVGLHVSYNLQQFIDSTCCFEYHRAPSFTGKGILCGPVSGRTPVCLIVSSEDGLPTNKTLIECAVRFMGENGGYSQDVLAEFDATTLSISCTAPAWPANELVRLHVTLSRGAFEQFVDSRVQFLFYDPPEGVIRIEPCAGPVTGGTNVLAWCGKIVDTGEITVCITLCNPAANSETNELEDKPSLPLNAKPEATSILVKGTIVGDAVSFVTPAVDTACVAFLNISLNGINYTSIQQQSNLKYVYYVSPVVRQIFPQWCSTEVPSTIRVGGDYFCDYGCRVMMRFVRQQHANPDQAELDADAITEARLVPGGQVTDAGSSLFQIEGMFPLLSPGFYEVEVSLNGQQFSNSHYMGATFGNFSGGICTSLLPLRVFGSPFFLATSTGPAAGGSSIVLFLANKLLKILAKENKCSVQFTPLRVSGETPLPTGLSSSAKNPSYSTLDSVVVPGEIDHTNSKVTCRAPLLRVACTATVDLLLPPSLASSDSKNSVAQLFNVKEREKYYSYESPGITEIYPCCGPISGGTFIVIETTNVIDTGQIFVRFRSSTNDRECTMIPGTYSRRFPDGSLSSSPLIICQTPPVVFVDKTITEPVGSTVGSSISVPQPPPTMSSNLASTRRPRDLVIGKVRTQMYLNMAEQSVKARAVATKNPDRSMTSTNVLRLTRILPKPTMAPDSCVASSLDLTLGTTVLVDFTLNAGEQFIAHSVKFYYHGELDPSEIKWSPRHLPTKSINRTSALARFLTVHLPKGLRLNDAADRISFRFDGDPQPLLAKRRGSSIVLHETTTTRELVSLDAPKLRSQATSRRRSTIMRNTSISASSGSLLSSSTPPTALFTVSTQPGRPRVRQTANVRSDFPSSVPSRAPVAPLTPYIVGKVVSASELSCPIPDFSTEGPVKVFLSLNAQQFVCLGVIYLHSPVAIVEDERFRFCSSVGGTRFTLRSTISSVLRYVLPGEITNEDEQRKSVYQNVLRQQSRACPVIGSTDIANESTSELSCAMSEAENNSEIRWKNRLFCTFHVLLLPANPSLLMKVSVTASRPECNSEIGVQTPDSNGSCVFEVTDWVGDVCFRAELPSETGYTSYSFLASSDTNNAREWSTESASVPIILMQYPSPDRVSIALFTSFGCTHLTPRFRRRDGSFFELKASIKKRINAPRGVIQTVEVGRDALTSMKIDEAIFSVEDEEENSDTLKPDYDAEPKNTSRHTFVQILVASCKTVDVCLFGEFNGRPFVWTVATIRLVADDSNGVEVRRIDCMGSQCDATRSQATCATENILLQKSALPTSMYSVPIHIYFSAADSSLNLSVYASASLVLGGSSDIVSFTSTLEKLQEVTMECIMPPLPFSGPTNVMVCFGGVMFSNIVCIQCYDPRTWKILAVEPPCGIARRAIGLRIKGKDFVETNKITVRFADEHRYFTICGALERNHLLVVRIAAIKNIRGLMNAIGSSGISNIVPSSPPQQKRDDEKGPSAVSSLGIPLPTTFTLTVRIECGDQSVFASCREATVMTALSTNSALSWEEQFEIQVVSKLTSLLVLTLEISDSTLPRPLEIARGIAYLHQLQEGVQRRLSIGLERHFYRGALLQQNLGAGGASDGEIDLALHLSPLMLQPDVIFCSIDGLPKPGLLTVQVSPGGNRFPALPPTGEPRNASPNSFQVYDSPIVTKTIPRVLPRSTGGEIQICGSGFIDVDGTGRVCVRLFCCLKAHFDRTEDESQVLDAINRVERLSRVGLNGEFFVRDIQGAVTSPTTISCVLPASLSSYKIFYRISFDGREYTKASTESQVVMFSVHSIEPKGGPISGNTYAALSGININACLALSSASGSALTPSVRLTWMRGCRELESVVLPGEFYPPDDTIYFYTPQSRFGLQNIAVNIELALVSAVGPDSQRVGSFAAETRFSRDEVSFIMYKVPIVRGVTPISSLIPGVTSIELSIQGFDEKATRKLKPAFKVRFKQRGQMQIADVNVVSEARFDCLVPRFNINRAVATEVSSQPAISKSTQVSPRAKAPHSILPANPLRSVKGPAKIWARGHGIFVVILSARNLRVSKKHTCNPFAIVSCGKSQLKSTRKDGTFAPVWNELFDFEWPTTASNASQPVVIRVIVENQLTLDQSEFLGQIELQFDARQAQIPLAFRAWLPLQHLRGKRDTRLTEPRYGNTGLGEIDVSVAIVPDPAQTAIAISQPRTGRDSSSATASLRASIISVISAHIASKKDIHEPAASCTLSTPSRKERLLRVFKQKRPPSSTVPTELQIDLALNGQDFWSTVPTRCYTLPPAIIFGVEPAFISVSGGSIMYISGLNFVNSGLVRVAFVAESASIHKRVKDSIIVDARFRSSTSLVCVSPPLTYLCAEQVTSVKIYVCLNGVDFDSIALPREVVKLSSISEGGPANQFPGVEETVVANNHPKVSTQPATSRVNIVFDHDRYLLACPIASTTDDVNLSQPPVLECRARVYQIPNVVSMRPTDGVYTSHLTFEGSNFTNTGVAIARFRSTSADSDVRVSPLDVHSSLQMTCSVPDFPRGTVVRIEISMNGVEFFPVETELRLYQLPRLTNLVPDWISTSFSMPLKLQGINLAATAASATPKSAPLVHISMMRGHTTRIVSAPCVDGEVHCLIPPEFLSPSIHAAQTPDKLVLAPPILVDVRLGGARKPMTGLPLPLRIYQHIPTVSSVAPMNGPVYGGFTVVVEGRNFVDTSSISIRFQYFHLITDQKDRTPSTDSTSSIDEAEKGRRSDDSGSKSTTAAVSTITPVLSDDFSPDAPIFVDAPGKFVSSERLICSAPTFPKEGVYIVLVALNGVEFSTVNEATWFLAWQNWQKRKQLLVHDIFAAPRLAREIDVSVLSPRGADASEITVVGTLDEGEIERLRRKTAFMLPQIKGTSRSQQSEGDYARTRGFDPFAEEELEDDIAELVSPKLLHWHPASAADEKGRPLLALLETLCNSRESQKIICRRLRIVFRMKGAPIDSFGEGERGEDLGHTRVSAFEATYSAFAQGLRLIFPHALERDIEALWTSCGGSASGRLTYKNLMDKVIHRIPDRRSGSPEPGPTHYNPQFDIVSPRAPAAVVLPQVAEPEIVAGLPSELFINYDHAYKAVKPTAPSTTFRKRKFNTSWCNPVSKEEVTVVRDSKSPETGNTKSAKASHFPEQGAHTLTIISEETTNAPLAESIAPTLIPVIPKSTLPELTPVVTPKPINGEDISEIAHRVNAATSAAALQSGSNLFYNDIAPIYLKFLRSKEIQKLMKIGDDAVDPGTRPTTRSGFEKR